MAVVLDAMAPYVKNLIMDMAKEEVSMLLGVSCEILKLEGNLDNLKAFLADAERKRITDEIVQRWVMKLKNSMYEATDILDLCNLEADKPMGSKGGILEDKVPSCFQPLLLCLRNPLFAHKIGSRIKELNHRLDGIHKEAQKFNFIDLGSCPEQRMPTNARQTSQKMTSEFDESSIVGEKIEMETRELAQLLITNRNHNIKVVSIVGTGGMGKTTLAQKIINDTTSIYDDKTVQEHFKVKIWLSVTQHFDEVVLLSTAIKQAGGEYRGGAQDKTLLTRTLIDTLSSKGRFFLVLDDLWSVEAWSQVLSVPIKKASQKQAGNWVLITTRLEDLAQQMGASFYQHHVSPLNEEDAWSLLNKQLPPSPSEVGGIDHLKDVGMKIINKCGGLPLAIKVMGGLLSTRHKSEGDWKAVLNHHAWSVVGLPKELDNGILLSYEDLSPQMKQCFLYCSLFPKGTSIWRTSVVPMWISEGFIQPEDISTTHDDRLEEIATAYYQELIKRNLIEPTENISVTGCACTMHDVVRSFAEFMAREESLVIHDDQTAGGSSQSLVRRLSIRSTKSVPEWNTVQKQKTVRTLIINCRINIKPSDSLSSLSTLRVLYISGADCDRLVDSLCQLRHLRFLHLGNTDISRLPDNIGRMKFLQHIVVLGSRNLESIPRSIIELVHLRTLDISHSNVNSAVPKGFGGLKNLRTLYGFPVHMVMDEDGYRCSLDEIGALPLLRDLSLHGLENVSTSWLAKEAKIGEKEHLIYLELNWSSSGSMGTRDDEIIKTQEQQQVAEEVLEELCPPSCVYHIRIKGYFGRRLPYWMEVPATAAFRSLTYLVIMDLSFCTQLPNGLCQLPSLKLLQITDAPVLKSVGHKFQAFSSTSASASAAAFPFLVSLCLEGLCEWEEWEWELEQQGVDVTVGGMAMPALERLQIRNCKLRCLPLGLTDSKRHALRQVELHRLPNLISVEKLHSVVVLDVFDCPELKRISGLSRLQKLRIVNCPNLEALEDVPVLNSFELEDATMETLPRYLGSINPSHLKLACSKKLSQCLFTGSAEYDKISHIKRRTYL